LGPNVWVQPDTLFRWHREGVRLVWKVRSRAATRTPRVPAEAIALIVEMARENRLWGAARIRAELLTLGIHMSKGTILKHRRRGRPPCRNGQTWATFRHNHAADVWACDFIQVTVLCFRSLFAFIIVEHASRWLAHVGVTRHPTDAWVAQQLREATPFGTAPRVLILDNDATFGPQFERVAAVSNIELRATLYQPPAYAAYFNDERPHQGINQAIPAGNGGQSNRQRSGHLDRLAVLGGLHHAYRYDRYAA